MSSRKCPCIRQVGMGISILLIFSQLLHWEQEQGEGEEVEVEEDEEGQMRGWSHMVICRFTHVAL
jgi:hypothetical protein